MEKIFFSNWESILRTSIITVFAYIGLILLLRISGKRTLSKMNAFDFVVTIALGSTLATVLLNKDVALLDGLVAFALLISLQYLITYLSARSKTVSSLVKSTPTLLVFRGQMLKEMMLKERIAEDEIYAVLREKGVYTLEQADGIVLETDGSLTLIKNIADISDPTLTSIIKPQTITTHEKK